MLEEELKQEEDEPIPYENSHTTNEPDVHEKDSQDPFDLHISLEQPAMNPQGLDNCGN